MKRFELRRVVFAQSVHTVVIYATTPTRRVVGEFTVKGIFTLPPDDLWDAVQTDAGLDEEEFREYFDGCNVGHAIEIASVVEYPKPLALHEFTTRPPQSFTYLP